MHFAVVARAVPRSFGVPVVEAAVRFRDVGVVEIAGVERRVERGFGDAVEHHEAHRQRVGVADEQRVTHTALLPGFVEETLQAFGRVVTLVRGERVFERRQLDAKLRAACLDEGLESLRPRRGRDDDEAGAGVLLLLLLRKEERQGEEELECHAPIPRIDRARVNPRGDSSLESSSGTLRDSPVAAPPRSHPGIVEKFMPRSIPARRPRRASRAGSVPAWTLHALLALLFAVLVIGVVMARTDRLRHLAHVADDQIGVIADHATGELRAIPSTGYQFVWPGLETVHTLTRSPVEYVMSGGVRGDANNVPYLIVRASDGSRFWFDRVAIQYTVDPAAPERALRDSGPDDGFRNGLVDAFARSILQEEFGRFDAADIMLPENRRSATERSQERLIEHLARHGITVLEVSMAKPRFEDRYEQTIERRKVAEQEIERLKREAEQLVAGQEQEQRHLERKLVLQLDKDSENWRREEAQLLYAAETLRAGRAVELDKLRRERGLFLATAQAGWTQAIANAEAELTRLESTRADRLAVIRTHLEREAEVARAGAARAQEVALRAVADRQRVQPAMLERLRREGELARAAAMGQAAAELAVAQRDALRRVAEAEATAAQREQLGALEHDARQARATELLQRHAREAETFRALTAALEQMGPAGVRAALVQGLAGVEIELATVPNDEAPEVRQAARR